MTQPKRVMAEQRTMTQSIHPRWAVLSSVVCLFTLAACGDPATSCPSGSETCAPDSSHPGTGDAGPLIDAGATDTGSGPMLRVELASDVLRLRRGEGNGFEVTVHRDGYVGDLVASVEGLPPGVTTEPVTLVSVITSRYVPVDVSESASAGGPYDVTVVVEAVDGSRRLTIPATFIVAGEPGERDESFGTGGISTAIAVQAAVRNVEVDGEGRPVLAGFSYGDTGDVPRRLLLARFGTDGRLDRDFADDGVILGLDAYESSASELVLVGDAPRVLGRRSESSTADSVRFVRGWDEDGRPDRGFADDGEWLLPDGLRIFAAVTDGEVLYLRGPDTLTVLRADGWARTAEHPAGIPRFSQMAYGDGALTTVFTVAEATGEVPSVGRLLTDSFEPDPAFGDGGVLRVPMREGERDDLIGDAIALLPDGGGYAASAHSFPGTYEGETEIIRFTPEGRLDPSFASDGRTLVAEERSAVGEMVVDGAGRPIALTTLFLESGGTPRQLRRFTTRGHLDPDFGAEGIVDVHATDIGFVQAIAHDDTADRLVVCGHREEAVRCMRLWL